MNIAFFGTSNKSTPILEALKNSEYDLKLCVTKSDVKTGRHQKIRSTAVKNWGDENRVQVITIDSIDTLSKDSILKDLKTNDIDLIIVADFAFIIPKEIFDFPRFKTINTHFSLLPNYRGSSPVQFSILNGDKKTGISYILMDEKLDSGSIVYQSTHEVSKTDTTETLYSKLFEKAGEEIADVIKNYVDGKYEPVEQNEGEASYTYSPTHPKSTLIYKEDAKVDWKKSDEKIFNMIRAYYPWPIAWTTLDQIDENILKLKPSKDLGKRIKLYKAHLENKELKIDTLQIEGKQKISWDDFKNGYAK